MNKCPTQALQFFQEMKNAKLRAEVVSNPDVLLFFSTHCNDDRLCFLCVYVMCFWATVYTDILYGFFGMFFVVV